MSESASGALRTAFGWLLAPPEASERAMRMEALIARLRVVIVCVNAFSLAFLLDTGGMRLSLAWWLVGIAFVYGLPVAIFEPYRRSRVFRASFATALLDSVTIALFVAVTGADQSPFFPLYYLSAAAVAMRFEMRQSLIACVAYMLSYIWVYFWSWDPGAHAAGVLLLRTAYMFFISVGVGHLAREEVSRAQQLDEIERLAAKNQRLQSRQERAARVDRLTGVLNRAHFEKEAMREIRRARAGSGLVSVLFCDMDGLKRVNDELGHEAGDRVLRHAGAALRRQLRTQDIVGRYGGDEFVALLPSVPRETAYDRAEQLIAAVRAVNESLPEHLHVGLSIGIATYPLDAPDYPLLVRVADQAMYLAKREGGGRVRTANDLRLFWEELPHTA